MSDPVAYFLDAPATPLTARALALSPPGPGQAVVEVDACGLCHTDLGFADGSVAPKHALPLVLGHEIVGTVVAAGDGVARSPGTRVLVPGGDAVRRLRVLPRRPRQRVPRAEDAGQRHRRRLRDAPGRARRRRWCRSTTLPGERGRARAVGRRRRGLDGVPGDAPRRARAPATSRSSSAPAASAASPPRSPARSAPASSSCDVQPARLGSARGYGAGIDTRAT